MANILANLSAGQLRRAVTIKERIETLERDLDQLLNVQSEAPASSGPRRRTMSAAAKARIAAAQRARWAKQKGSARPAKAAGKSKRRVSPAARARMAAAARERWKAAKASGRN